ncbi:11712_t:CDS:2 [Cetraspora pellucida]|uniref:11712_t:CDS:1 n=1 Tax=Cetraspora pellucida TaxID=1433469 RepID=A0ACA9L1N1_9GLOM|nr:11712_t:CDS:2 [Cetraspora pellucida]
MDTDFYQENILDNQKSIEMQTYTKYLAIIGLKYAFDNSNCSRTFVIQKCNKHDNQASKNLLKRLFNDESFELLSDIELSCSLVLSSNSKRKTCGFLHRHPNGTINEELIIKHQCDVKYFKIISYDTKKYPYVIPISKGIHKHLPPPSSKVPVKIINKLKIIIEETSEDLIDITPRKLISNLDYAQAKGLGETLHSINKNLSWDEHLYTEIWFKTPDNTNVAEASHANINRNSKALSLENAILNEAL